MSKMRFYALQELANRRPLEVTTPSNKLSDYYGSSRLQLLQILLDVDCFVDKDNVVFIMIILI